MQGGGSRVRIRKKRDFLFQSNLFSCIMLPFSLGLIYWTKGTRKNVTGLFGRKEKCRRGGYDL